MRDYGTQGVRLKALGRKATNNSILRENILKILDDYRYNKDLLGQHICSCGNYKRKSI